MPKKSLVRIEEGITAATAAVGCAALLDAGLEERLGPATDEDATLGAGGGLAVRLARRMEALRRDLEVAKETLERVRDDLRGWRQRRDLAQEKVYERAKQLRELFRGLFPGDEGDRLLGLHGALPREPKVLHAAFGRVLRRLADADWPMPERTPAGHRIRPDRIARSMIERHHELGECLGAVRAGETREAMAQAAKNRAAKAHAELVGKGTRFLKAALDLAGLDDLAATMCGGRAGRPPKDGQTAASRGLPGGRKALADGSTDR